MCLTGTVARYTNSFFGGILYLWQSSDTKHSTVLVWLSSFFSPWKHVIVPNCFYCSEGSYAFLVLSFLSSVLPLGDQLPCVEERRRFKGTSNTKIPGYAGTYIFPLCQAPYSSCWGVSMTHSFVLWQRAKMPVIPRNIFRGQNAKPRLHSMSSFKKKKCWIIIVLNILLPHDFSFFMLSLVLWYILNPPSKIRDGFSD